MKTMKVILLCMAVCMSNSILAQYRYAPQPPNAPVANQSSATLERIIDSMISNSNPNDTDEGGERDEINSFRAYWQGRVVANGTSGPNMFEQYNKVLRTTALAGRGSCTGSWRCVGPDNMPKQIVGRVDAVWADPADSNYIFAGALTGGLFKTTNGGGNWTCVTDNAPIAGGAMGISNIAVNPLNRNHIYLGTLGAGILYSFDGGGTWRQEFIQIGASPNYSDTMENTSVYMTEDSTRLYAISGKKVFTRAAPVGSSWVDITPARTLPLSDSILTWNSFVIVPQHPTHFFVSGEYSHTYYGVEDTSTHPVLSMPTGFIWESTVAVPTGSTDWTNISAALEDTLNLYWPTGAYRLFHDTDMILFKLSAPNNKNLYAICVPAFDQSPSPPYYSSEAGGLYKYSFATHKWTNLYRLLHTPNATHFEIAVSPSDSNTIYYGSNYPWVSYNEGRNFETIGTYDGQPTHADTRCIFIQRPDITDSGKDDRVFFANDGGVSKKPSGVNMHKQGQLATKDISGYGLTCGTFFGFSTSEAGGIGIGGMMHDGVVSYEPLKTPQWKSLNVSDAWRGTIDRSKPEKGLVWWNSNYLALSETGVTASRKMDTLIYKYPKTALPNDASFPGVGAPIETDNIGNTNSVQNQFWSKSPGGSVFTPASGLGFPSASDLCGAYLAFDPTATSYTGYVLYYGVYRQNEIYYRNPGVSITTALNISRPIDNSSFPATDITTDQRNPERVWVSQGGINYHTYAVSDRRAQFSPNHGITWYDISTGLPQRIPVSHIVYDETMDILYCSTDAGIYKCDFSTFDPSGPYVSGVNTSVSWYCFSGGAYAGHDFPNITVNSLAINHCQGKLYASTFGRSIWSTDIHNSGTIAQPSDIIRSSVTWSGGHHHYLNGGIDVPAGVTLTIRGDTVHMPKDGLIIVEPGGKLVLDHALVTNSCDRCMWQGIQVRGHTGMEQTAANQGWLVVTNATVIEHARIAMANCNTDPALFYGTTGGIIQASSSTFLNNGNDVTFHVYDNWDVSGTILSPNRSYFYCCNFVLNDNYRGNIGGPDFKNMVYLSGVEGIKFLGCQFLNRDNVSDVNRRLGEGIHSHNSGFIVDNYGFPPSVTRSRFCGFRNGIYVENVLGYAPGVNINGAIFDTVSVGEYISVAEDVTTTRCDFIVGHGNGVIDFRADTFLGCSQNIGINVHNSPTFIMEGNTFTGKPNHSSTPSGWQNFGVVVANTGGATYPNVYRNVFGDSLTYGVYAVGVNRHGKLTYNPGLLVTCNTFSKNYTDIRIGRNGVGAYADQGICHFQSEGYVSASNTFACSPYNIVNTAMEVIYYNDGSPAAFCPTPSKYPLYCVPSIDLHINTCKTINTCATTLRDYYPSGFSMGRDRSEIDILKSDFYTAKADFISAEATYRSAVDFGSTTALLARIDTSTYAPTLYSYLSSGAPFLSIAAVEDAARILVLSHAEMFDVMARNPDNLHDSAFIAYVNTEYSFTVPELDSLDTAGYIETDRTVMETNLGALSKKMSDDATLIIMALKTPIDTNVSVLDTTGEHICTDSNSVYFTQDSNSHYVWLDSIDTWLQNRGGIWTNYSRLGYYHFRHHNEIADTILTHVSSILPSITDDPDSWETYNSYASLWGVIKGAEADGRDEYRLTSGEISSLAIPSEMPVTFNSGRLLAYSTGYSYSSSVFTTAVSLSSACLEVPVFTGFPSGKPGRGQETVVKKDDNAVVIGAAFSAYPNPASGIVTFSCNIPGGCVDMKIVVSNALGERVAEVRQSNTIGKAQWNTKGVSPGVYIYDAYCAGSPVCRGKLVVVK